MYTEQTFVKLRCFRLHRLPMNMNSRCVTAAELMKALRFRYAVSAAAEDTLVDEP
jgi:hypothetical protein